ncbi:MAG: HDOD domain-containing protein [Planctomycetota bacterium]
MNTAIDVSQIDSLAPMPASALRLARLMLKGDASLVEVADVIKLDEALTANVLRTANSAWAGARAKAATTEEVVVRIGTEQVFKLAIGRTFSRSLQVACPGYELAEDELWRHSVAAALAAEQMGRFAAVVIPPVAFTAALLHDIGKLLLGRQLGLETVSEIRTVVEREGLCFVDAERRILGTDHAEVGGAIARHWDFPELLVRAIELHHDPSRAPEPLMDAVHVANAVAKLVGEGLGSEQMNMKVSTEAPVRLGLSFIDLEALCAGVRSGLADAEAFYSGDSHGT